MLLRLPCLSRDVSVLTRLTRALILSGGFLPSTALLGFAWLGVSVLVRAFVEVMVMIVTVGDGTTMPRRLAADAVDAPVGRSHILPCATAAAATAAPTTAPTPTCLAASLTTFAAATLLCLTTELACIGGRRAGHVRRPIRYVVG